MIEALEATVARQIPIGISDFKKLRTGDYYYVDKSELITDVVHSGAEIILLPRPRRFGKTINLSMLRYFFDMTLADGATLFEGLQVARDAEVMTHCGAYPVVFLTFKDVKYSDYQSCHDVLARILAELFLDHEEVIVKAKPRGIEQTMVKTIMDGTAKTADLQGALALVTKLLHRATGKKAIVLIDEYDAPIHAGYRHVYYAEIIAFMRNLLSGAFKDNNHLEKGVVTGILRVAKESIFSGFNNPRVRTILDEEFSDRFGFTETEVARLLSDFNLQDRTAEVKRWYNGYRFGPHTIYNPWSIMQYTTDARFATAKAEPYWVNTSDNKLVHDLIVGKNAIQSEDLETLLAGGAVRKQVNTNIVLDSLKSKAVWSMLTFSGYLKAEEVLEGRFICDLAIPNLEVRTFFEETVRDWLDEQVGGNGLEPLLNALIGENMEALAHYFSEMVVGVLSFHDSAGKEPERVYHAFLLGILVNLRGQYRVTSNRESGFGRYDVCLIPVDPKGTGFVFEFKRVEKQTLQKTAKKALEQIITRNYATELLEAGVSTIRAIGVAIDGKRARIDSRRL